MRPTRGDILDNFMSGCGSEVPLGEVVALMAQMRSDSKQEVKLTVRRSRRRPNREVRLPLYDFNEPPGPNRRSIEQANEEEAHWFEGEWGFPRASWVFDWTSPAQLGRKMGRQKKREKSTRLIFQGPHGPIEVIAHPQCPDGSLLMMGTRFTTVPAAPIHALPLPPRPILLSDLTAAVVDEMASGRATDSIRISPRNWSRLNSQAASMRMYSSKIE